MAETKISKAQAGSGIWTSDSLVAGTNISITEVQKPVIDEHTVLLFHGDSITDTGFVDEIQGSVLSDGTHPYTLSSYHKFGTNSIDLGQSNYNPSPRYAAFGDFTVNSFTVDFWFYNEAGKYPKWAFTLQQSSSSYAPSYTPYFVFYTSGSSSNSLTAIAYSYPSSASIPVASNIIDTSVAGWHHFAACFDSDTNTLYCFIDGSLVSSGTVLNFNTNYLAMTGRGQYDSSSNMTTIVDEIRVSNVCRWTSNFTPFTSPYSAATGETQYQINNTQAAADTDLSNVTSTGKATAIGWLKPDLTAGVSLTSGDNPPCLGYVQFKGSNISNAYCFCYINSVQVVQLGSTGTQNGEIAGLYLVDSTDTITATSATITFFPAVGA